MALSAGTRIGPHEIVAPLGAGGMGEVYRARDTRLNRDVAIKALPAAVAGDPERLGRFRREAQLLASLNHPNIAAIYGLEETDLGPFLVLELVEGDDLAARLARGALPVDEAVAVGRQIAEALEEAHEKGIIHRDLKPANVKLGADGRVKVLDFGLAKAIAGDAAAGAGGATDSPTLTARATEAGAILGTAAYMSPEQARGRSVDRRADIWAFGVVLAEMLTGRPLFARESVAETLGAIFEQPFAAGTLPAAVPPAVRRLVARCLDRDPRTRLRDIGEARVLLSSPEATAAEPEAAGVPWRGLGRGPWPAVAAGVLVVAGAAGGWLLAPRGAGDPPVRTLDFIATNLQTGLSPNLSPVLSPDGTRLLFAADNRLWIRRLDRVEAEPVAGSEAAAYFTWAPDSRSVAFVRDERLWRAGVDGGGAIALGPAPDGLGGAGGTAWNTRDEIVLSGSADVGLAVLPGRGGAGTVALALDKTRESDFHEVSALPDGRGWLFAVHRLEGTDTLAVLAGGVRKDILQIPGETLRSPVYAPTGHLLYQRAQTNPGLWAVRFSLDRLETEGPPFLVAAGASQPSVSSDGTLVFVRQAEASRQFAWVTRSGTVERFGPPMNLVTQADARQFRLSPDGRYVSYVIWEGAPADAWVYDRVRGASTRLTTGSGASTPVWAADSRRVLFAAFQGERLWQVYARNADATGGVDTVVRSEAFKFPLDVSRDGRWLVYAEGLQALGRLWATRLDRPAAPEPLAVPRGSGQAVLSPDGRWIAYVANDTGRWEVYVQPFPSGAGRWPVSTGGGWLPAWSADGRELIFRAGDRVMAAPVRAGATFEAGAARVLFAAGLDTGLSESFEVGPDGRLLMVQTTARDRVTVVLTFPAEIRRLESTAAVR